MKKIISSVLALAMVLCIFPFAGFSLTAFAASESDLTFELTYDGYAVSSCDKSASGELVIPNEYNGKSVTEIDDSAFKDCKAITSVTIPVSVIRIGNYAFENCTGITSLTILGSEIDFFDGVFSGCTSINEINVPDDATYMHINYGGIGSFVDTAYYKDESNWENGILYIGNHLVDVKEDISGACVIKDGIKKIPRYAFHSRTNLTSVTIPSSVTYIGEYAFGKCTSLELVTIPAGAYIEEGAFDYCDSDLTIKAPTYSSAHDYTIEHSIKFVSTGETSPFRYESYYEGESYQFSHCALAFKGDIVIPSEYNGKPVMGIKYRAFEDCKAITSVTIPNGVIDIDDSAFKNCTELTSVIIPESVIWMNNAFENCNSELKICGYKYSAAYDYACKNNMNFISLGETSPIRLYKYRNSDSYEIIKCSPAYKGDVVIPSEYNGKPVTEIGSYAFNDCTGLTTVEIPVSVTSIEYDAFENCNPDLVIIGSTYSTAHDFAVRKSFKFSSNGTVDPFRYELNEDGESYTLSHCSEALQGEVEVVKEYNGKPVTRIGYSAFPLCKGITAITIPGTVKSIAGDSFLYCTELKSVKIQEGVIEVGSRAFWMCDKVESIELPDSLIVVGYQGVYGGSPFYHTAYYNNPDNWQDGVLYIGNHLIATKKDEVPANYQIKEGTKTISGDAFSGCENLKSISIPESVVNIGPWAFDESGVKNDQSNWENGVFYVGKHAVFSDKTLVPSDLKIKEGTVSISVDAFDKCANISTVQIPNTVKYIGHSAFLGCEELKSAYIPESVTYIGGAAFGWRDGGYGYEQGHNVVIYGYEGTEAERSAKSDGNTFVALDVKLADEESGIKVSGNIDEAAALEVKLLSSDKSKITYDITLTKDGKAIQPDGTVTVKIPVPESLDGAKCRVYRVEENGKNTDMNAEFKDGFMVFKTTHFSKYILTTDDLSVVYGDINGDGKINTVDLAMLRKYLANKDPATGESSVSVGAGADVNGDGKINTVDLAMLRKYLANKDPVTGESSVILGPKK